MKAHQLKTLAAFTSLAVALSAVVQPASALTVPEAITSIQTSNPTLPTGVANPKGNIGFLLANMFWNSSDVGYDSSKFGKIKPTYFDGAGATAWTNTLSGTYLTNASENVGIGTSNPQAKLHVEGKVKAGVFSSKQGAPDAIDDSTNGFSFGTDGDTWLFAPGSGNSAGQLAFYSNNSEKLRINGTGIGINTASPRSSLDVNWGIVAGDSNGYAFFVPKSGTDPWTNYDRFELRVDPSSQVTWLGNVNAGTGTSRALAFLTGNAERMRIDASGNVGIGISTPSAKFEVLGDTKAYSATFTDPTSQSASTGALRLTGGAGGIILDDGGHKRLSWNDGGGNLNLRWGSYVQSGTGLVYAKSPNENNGWAATITLNMDQMDGSITLATAPIGVPWTPVSYSNTLTVGPTNSYFTGTGNLGIWTTAPTIKFAVGDSDTGLNWAGDGLLDVYSNNVNTMSVRSGDVGIGTATPSARLDVQAAGNANSSTTTPNVAWIPLFVWASSTDGIAIDSNQIERVGNSSPLHINYNSTANLILNYGFGSGGNVGVGVLNPTQKLEVWGVATAYAFHAYQGAPNAWDSSTVGYAFGSDGDTGIFSPGSWSANGVMAFFSNNGEVMRISTGNVGIGTNAPAYKLDVTGTANVTGFRMPTGAGAGKVLTSDASGLAAWATPTAGTAHSTRVVTANCMDTGGGECNNFSASCNSSTEVLTWWGCNSSSITSVTTSAWSCWGVAQWVTGTAYAVCLAK